MQACFAAKPHLTVEVAAHSPDEDSCFHKHLFWLSGIFNNYSTLLRATATGLISCYKCFADWLNVRAAENVISNRPDVGNTTAH